MNETTAVATLPAPQSPSLVARFAARYNVDPKKLLTTLKSTAFKQQPDGKTGQLTEVTDEEMMSLLIVAERYGLDPFTKQIYAFRDRRRGGIVPIVGVDGWITLVNDNAQFNGVTFATGTAADGKLEYVECTLYRKDREHPTTIREYLRENKRDTDAWSGMPNRMLRHRAFIQCGRIAFGLTGIYDDDEGRAIIEGTATTVHESATITALNAEITGKPIDVVPETVGDTPPAAQDGSGQAHGGDAAKPAVGDDGPAVTFAQVAAALQAAKTADALDLAGDLIRSIPYEQQRAELDVELRAAKIRLAKA